MQSRPTNNQTRMPSSNPYTQRPDSTRKPSFSSWNADLSYDHALEMDRSKLAKPYGIFPGPVPDMYIYERSISSASDLPGSPSSSSSSSSDTELDATTFALEVASIRASSSTETLEATATAGVNTDATTSGRSPYGQSVRKHHHSSSRAPVVPPGVVIPGTVSTSSMTHTPIALPDDDEGTVVDSSYDARRIPSGMSLPASTPVNVRPPGLTPLRRNSDDRTPRGTHPPRVDASLSRGSSQSRSRSASPTEYNVEGDPSLRAPPGLQFVAPSPPGSHPHPHHRATISLPIQQRPSAPSPEVALSRVVSNPEGVAAANVRRTVRWTEDLICPSPVPPEQRRKGWYNRRGYVQTPTHHIHTADPASHRDQLWTNDGMYKTAEPGQEYPSDLAVRV